MKDPFVGRNKLVTNLIKLGDSLGRSLRQNVSIFKIDDLKRDVAYVTESNHIISGKFELTPLVKLTDINVQNADVFEDTDKFNKVVSEKVHNFVAYIHQDQVGKASTGFDDVLDLWKDRFQFSNIVKNLQEKASRFNDSLDIIHTDEFQKFLEISPNLIRYLKEKKNTFTDIYEIQNAVRLASTVSRAFNMPKLTLEALLELEEYTISEELNDEIYRIICRQELIKQELLESKVNFANSWAFSDKIQALAGLIVEEDQSTVEKALAEAIQEVPYLALATKQILRDTLEKSIGDIEECGVDQKDIAEYASVLFEMKKPVRNAILRILNEKYGISVVNLKESASFKGLTNTHVVIFECLAKLSPPKSLQREALLGVANMLKEKSGIESIDVTDIMCALFEEAGYTQMLGEFNMSQYLNFDALSGDLGNISQVLAMIQKVGKDMIAQQSGQMMGQMGAMGGMGQMGGGQPAPQMAPNPAGPGGMGNQPGSENDDAAPAMGNSSKPADITPEDNEAGMQEPTDIPGPAGTGTGVVPSPDSPVETDTPPDQVTPESGLGMEQPKNKFIELLKSLEAVVGDLAADMGLGMEDDTMGQEPGGMELDPGMEGGLGGDEMGGGFEGEEGLEGEEEFGDKEGGGFEGEEGEEPDFEEEEDVVDDKPKKPSKKPAPKDKKPSKESK